MMLRKYFLTALMTLGLAGTGVAGCDSLKNGDDTEGDSGGDCECEDDENEGECECEVEDSEGDTEDSGDSESGDSGESGESGESGDSGESGESGDTGDSGESGETGDTGEPELVIQFQYRPDPEKTGQEGTWRKKRLAEAALQLAIASSIPVSVAMRRARPSTPTFR